MVNLHLILLNSMAVYIPTIYDFIGKVCQFIAIQFFIKPFYAVFYKVRVVGKENIPKDKTACVVMPNHLSNNDPPLVSASIDFSIAWMAKDELFRVPILGWIITLLAAFSVNREKVEKTTIKAAKEIIKKKWSVGVFLEGTRSKIPGQLGKPNAGPAYIAILGHIPILPVGIVGSDKRSGEITIKIGKPFYPDKDLEKARWQCAEKLSELTGFKIPKDN